MEQLKTIKEQLIAQVQSQMGDLRCVDTKELGEVIDMIKDLSEAVYYCAIYEQMEEAKEHKEEMGSNNYYYTEKYIPMKDWYRDMDRDYGRMYYPNSSSTSGQSQGGNSGGQSNGSNNSGGRNYYTERDYPIYMRDQREGRSPMKRRMYMESKDTHQDQTKAMQDLEAYMQDLTSDMMEMVDKASPEEKAMLQKKVNTLASKLQNV